MHSILEEEVKMIPLKGRSYKLLASKETVGCNNLCAGISIFPSGKHAPGHIHDIAEEVVYCLEGTGEAIIDKEVIKIKPGTVIYSPPGSLHSINNTGKDEIKFFYVFSPSIEMGAYKDYDNE